MVVVEVGVEVGGVEVVVVVVGTGVGVGLLLSHRQKRWGGGEGRGGEGRGGDLKSPSALSAALPRACRLATHTWRTQTHTRTHTHAHTHTHTHTHRKKERKKRKCLKRWIGIVHMLTGDCSVL